MKVLHLITTLEPGGAEKHLMHLSQEQSRRGHDVVIVFLKGKGTLKKQFTSQEVRIESRLADKNIIYQFIHLVFLIKKSNLDIVHCHLPRSEILGILASIVLKNKVILSKHNSEKFWPKGPNFLSISAARFINLRANAIICISSATRDYLLSMGEVRSSKSIFVVHYGITRPAVIDQVSIRIYDEKPLRLLTFSRLVPQKNLTNLILAISSLKLSGLDVLLDIYGEGPLEAELLRLTNDLNLSSQVRINKPVLHSDLILAGCDIFLLVSHYEGFGLAALEAVSRGKPVIASNTGALKEVLGPTYPYLVDQLKPKEIADMVERVRQDLISGVSPNFNEILSRFDLSDKVSKIDDIYRVVVGCE